MVYSNKFKKKIKKEIFLNPSTYANLLNND